MTPQERQLIGELFERLASLENGPRDPDAEAAIREGFRRAPNAAYSLVQTVLVQDEALKAANAHIQEYERASGGAPQSQEPPRGFLDQMRDSIFGRDEPRGSVPRVPQGGGGAGAPMGAPPGYRADPWGGQAGGQPGYQQGGYQQGGYPGGAPMQQAPMGGGGGGSFLGTAAAVAAGAIGGSLLMGGIRSAMGGHQSSSPASHALDSLSGRGDGGSGNASGSDLARDAGAGDVGGRGGFGGDTQRAGAFGGKSQAEQDAEDDAQGDAEDAAADGGYDDGGDTQDV